MQDSGVCLLLDFRWLYIEKKYFTWLPRIVQPRMMPWNLPLSTQPILYSASWKISFCTREHSDSLAGKYQLGCTGTRSPNQPTVLGKGTGSVWGCCRNQQQLKAFFLENGDIQPLGCSQLWSFNYTSKPGRPPHWNNAKRCTLHLSCQLFCLARNPWSLCDLWASSTPSSPAAISSPPLIKQTLGRGCWPQTKWQLKSQDAFLL